MDELKAYADRRLELGDLIRTALYLAQASRDEQAENQARGLLTRLAAGTFRLAVVGQFSRGKSTLMNALLGGPYLPMGAQPMTSVITTVRYGSHPRAIVRRRGQSLGTEVALAAVAEYVAQASATRAEHQVASVEVEIPVEMLRLGFEFIDTPGVGSAIETSTATTRRFLPQADAVIFVTGFDSPLTQAEEEFLADAARHAGKLFLVLNKRDLLSGQDADAVLEFVRHRLRDYLCITEPRLFALSALEGLEAVVRDDGERLAGSGLPELHAELRQFLTAGKAQLFLRSIAGHAADLVAGQQRSLRLGRLSLDGNLAPEAVLAAFDARMADLDRQRSVIAGTIADRIQARLPGLLAARRRDWQLGLLDLLGPLAADALPTGEMDGAAHDLLERAGDSLERAGRKVISDWLNRRTGEVLEIITGVVASEVGGLLEVARSPGLAGAEIVGLATEDDRRELAGWSAEDVPALAIQPPEWIVHVDQPRRSWRKAGLGDAEARDRLDAALAAAADAFTDRVQTACQSAARDWARRLDEQAAIQMRQVADRFRWCVQNVPSDEDLAALDRLAARLAAFQAALDIPGPSPGRAEIVTPADSSEATVRDDCTVCQQMEQTLTSHLFTGQFLLATRDDEQDRHALGRGFCPLHTWQYAAVASPVGISAGYAPLAASVAEALESLSRQDSPAAELARDVASLSAGTARCPVCTALAASERSAIAELVSQAPPLTITLCLRHLALTLSAGADPATCRALLRAAATALRRESEDMRSFALKREAYRRGLVTAEESRAHLDALRQLAGQPALAQPWVDQESAAWLA